MKKILLCILVTFAAAMPTVSSALSIPWDRPAVGRINPINILDTVYGNIFIATSTTNHSVFPYASSTLAFTDLGPMWLKALTGPSGLGIDSDGKVYAAATTTFSSPLVYTSGTGAVTCPTCTVGGLTAYDPFPVHPASGVSATTSQINMAGFLSTASSTINANATTTGTMYSTIASSTRQITSYASSSVQTFGSLLYDVTNSLGTNGFVLAQLTGGPKWVATTTFSSGLTYASGGVTCDVATGSIPGCLSASDWTTFNNKQAPGFQIATTSGISVPQVAYFTKASGVTTLGGAATSSLTASGVVSVSNTPAILGASTANITITGGSNGQVLAWAGGVPAWTATTTITPTPPVTATFSAGAWTIGCATCTTGGVTSVSGNYPISSSGGTTPAISIVATSTTYGTSTAWATLAVNPIAGAFSNRFVVGSSSATSFVINNAGNVGVNTTTPTSIFSINGAGNGFRIDTTGTVQEGIWSGTVINVNKGGTGAATLTGLLQGNGTNAVTVVTDSSTVGQILRVTGSSAYGWGALDLADTDAITGDLPFANLTQVSANSVLANNTSATADARSVATSTFFGQPTAGFVLAFNSGSWVGVATTSITPTSPVTATFASGAWTVGCATCNTSNATVSSIATNNGITGGTITTSGTIGLATINAGVLGAVTNGSVPTSQSTSTLYGAVQNGKVLAGTGGTLDYVATTTLTPTSPVTATFAAGTWTVGCATCRTAGVTSVTGTYPISSSGGETPAISIVSTSTFYGSSTPWATLAVNPTAGQFSNQFVVGSSSATNFLITNAGKTGVGTTSPFALLSVNAPAGSYPFAVGSSSRNLLYVTDLGTTTVGRGFDIIGAVATSSSNVGFNITTGCYALNNTCIGGVASVSGTYPISSSGGSTPTISIVSTSTTYGTSTPWATLAVNPIAGAFSNQFVVGSSSATSFLISNAGFTGISTTSPATNLSVGGNLLIGASTAGGTNGTLTYGGVTLSNTVTGTGAMVLATSPALTTPNLGIPSALTLTNATGLPVAGLSNLGSNVGTWLVTPTSANFASAVTGETGTGAVVFDTSPSFTTSIALASSTPWAALAINPIAGGASNKFAVGSSTGSAFLINNAGYIGVGTTSPFARLTLANNGSIAAMTASSSILVEEYVRNATSTAMTVKASDGNNQVLQIGTSATTITLDVSSFMAGEKMVLAVCNPGTTAGAITWATSNPTAALLWTGGTAPTQTTTANKCDVYSCFATQATSTTAHSASKLFCAQTPNF